MEQIRFSEATLENVHYLVGGQTSSEHDNEDRSFTMAEKKFCACAVFDGHDGSSAVDHANRQFNGQLHVLNTCDEDKISLKLAECFKGVEHKFFSNVQSLVEERSRLQAAIPPEMKSYQAYQEYPREVARLQELEPLISGGCTAVVSVVCGNKLYVANVGDSRAVVVRQTPNGALETLQLSTDHDVKNEEELKRLEKLGLNREELKRAGRLGPQENTRSIGDYNIKGGYQSVDVLRFAASPPGITEPSVRVIDLEATEIRGRAHYLILMSDGVYKSIEAQFNNVELIDSNKVVAGMVEHCEHNCDDFGEVAQATLNRLVKVHSDKFSSSVHGSGRAQACSRRDDMTLLVYKFV